MDDYFSNTRSNDELTLREAWDNFTKGLISKEQWAETLEGVKRLKQNVPAVAETWARGTIAPIFGGTGDINELGDTTRNKLIDMLPANVGKFAKNLDAAQRLFTPATLTRHLPTTKEVLASTPRVTPKHEGAETMEDVAGFVSPGTLGLSNDLLKLGKNLPVGNMITFHGSPNEFERFDPTRVGSGNSTNYGHGIYTAENQNVAKGFTGRTVINEPNVNKFTFNGPDYTIANGQFLKNGTPITQKEYEKAFEGITNLWNTQNKGHIYKVDIPDKHAHKLLDWDKPFSEQTPYVQKIIKEIDPTVTAEETGREIYTALSKPSRYKPNSPMNKFLSENPNLNPQAAASKFLNEKGILGNKYENFQIKQGQGANTHNYVIFDPENLNILERNGKSLATSSYFENTKPFKTAQKNAAKPVEEGGLGLPANNTAADRAKAMGFNTPAYHGTRIDFNEFQKNSWFSSDPKYASEYSNVLMRNEPENPTQQVIPVLTKITKPHKVKYFGSEDEMKKILSGGKKETYVIENVGGGDTTHYVIKNPKNIRSKFAAFDPAKMDEPGMLNAVAPIGVGSTLGTSEYFERKKK